MIHQTNPNNYSCLVTSFAMCVDLPVQYLLDQLPDGEKIAFHHESRNNHRGFHPQELIDLLYGLSFRIMEIEARPEIGYGPGDSIDVFPNNTTRLKKWIAEAPCVVTGRTLSGDGHAVAYDPKTRLYHNPAKGYNTTKDCPLDADIIFPVFDLKIS